MSIFLRAQVLEIVKRLGVPEQLNNGSLWEKKKEFVRAIEDELGFEMCDPDLIHTHTVSGFTQLVVRMKQQGVTDSKKLHTDSEE